MRRNVKLKIRKSFLDFLSTTTKGIIFFFNSDGFNPPQPPKQAFVTQPRAMPIFSQYLRESPCRVQCPSCQNTIVTIPQPKNGLAVYAIAAGLCFVGYVHTTWTRWFGQIVIVLFLFLGAVVVLVSHFLSMIWKMLHMYALIVTLWLDNIRECDLFGFFKLSSMLWIFWNDTNYFYNNFSYVLQVHWYTFAKSQHLQKFKWPLFLGFRSVDR